MRAQHPRQQLLCHARGWPPEAPLSTLASLPVRRALWHKPTVAEKDGKIIFFFSHFLEMGTKIEIGGGVVVERYLCLAFCW